MAVLERSKSPEPTPEGEPVRRPKIWIEGQQRPRFDVRAFMNASYGMAKRDLAPAIADTVERLQGLGHLLARGEIRLNVSWAGRFAKVVPSHTRVAGWVLWLSGQFEQAQSHLVPPTKVAEDIAYPGLIRSATVVALRQAVPNVDTPPRRPTVEPTLHAIRSAISQTAHDFAGETIVKAPNKPVPADPIADDKPGWIAKVKQQASHAASWVVLGVLMVFALPAGAARALIFHADGGDLREWL